ncbi:MAG: hypothetical protein A3F41_00930 [Coxiella sp. RIFCSPHIGHO2_12_FULL_44_14]|nr:MAG: hypothetical protein A3F41_00930 [Coxiella sp. RIFCSPHIGHO2_12_FULL_44_14]
MTNTRRSAGITDLWYRSFGKPGLSLWHSLKEETPLLLEAWKKRSDVFWGILLGSLVINLLSVAFPIALLQVYDRVIPNSAFHTLILLLLGVGTALLLEMMLKIGRLYLSSWSDVRSQFLSSQQLFHHLINAQLTNVEKEGVGAHIKRLSLLNLMQDFYSGSAVIALIDLPFLLLFLWLIVYIGGWLVWVTLAVLSIFIIRLIPYLQRLQLLLQESQRHDDKRTNFLVETLTNIHTLKATAMEAQMLRRYERLQKKAAEYDHDLSINNAQLVVLTNNLSQLMIVAVVGFGSLAVMQGSMTVGGLAASMLLAIRCIQPIGTWVTVWSRLKLITVARAEVQSLLQMPLESKAEALMWGKIRGKMTMQEVSFRYAENQPWIIKDLNLTIEAGECLAITGEREVGKSALLWLLAGILSPSAGRLLIDDKEITHYQREGLRDQIGYLPQNPVLFSGTILENLTLFQVEKYQDQVKKIAPLVGLDQVIKSLPNGYDTLVANRTSETLARGINQRIAIVRALIKEPPIVLFDEANASIDLAGDVLIKKLLEYLKGRCTLILVSHRPSVIQLAPKRYRLEQGQLYRIME